MRRLVLLIVFMSFKANAMLIAHRGVHQTYDRDGLDNETCTANRAIDRGHNFIENTLQSIEEAFRSHADMVEIDIHPTTELNAPDQVAVFHDWTLDCRTNATCENGCKCNEKKQCITNEQDLSLLQTLDIGFGYTYDGGKKYPLRGQFVGVMPQLEDVLKLLEKYPNKKILVNVKGNLERTNEAFIRIVQKFDQSIRERLYYPYYYGRSDELKELQIQQGINQADKKCIFSYLKVGWKGEFPKECHNKRIMIPIRETLERVIGRAGRYVKFTTVLWGWPERFIKLAHKHGTEVYASQVDSIEEYEEMNKYDLDGMMTNRIEIIGPYINGN